MRRNMQMGNNKINIYYIKGIKERLYQIFKHNNDHNEVNY